MIKSKSYLPFARDDSQLRHDMLSLPLTKLWIVVGIIIPFLLPDLLVYHVTRYFPNILWCYLLFIFLACDRKCCLKTSFFIIVLLSL